MISVLESNPAGRRFWPGLGFAPHAVTMETFLPAERAGA